MAARRKPLPPPGQPTTAIAPVATGPLVRRSGNGVRGPAGEITITDEGVAEVERLARGGLANKAIASKLGIARQSLETLRQRDPRVDEAFERGRAGLEVEVVDLLLQQGRNGNTTALIWLSKNRLGWRDNPAVQAEQVNVQIIGLRAAMSPQEYERAMALPLLPAAESDPADVEIVEE